MQAKCIWRGGFPRGGSCRRPARRLMRAGLAVIARERAVAGTLPSSALGRGLGHLSPLRGRQPVIYRAHPLISSSVLTPWASIHCPISFVMRVQAFGSRKFAVPTCTAAAPAMMNSKASLPVRMPPSPTTGDADGPYGLPDHAQGDGAHRRAGQARKRVVEHGTAHFPDRSRTPGRCCTG